VVKPNPVILGLRQFQTQDHKSGGQVRSHSPGSRGNFIPKTLGLATKPDLIALGLVVMSDYIFIKKKLFVIKKTLKVPFKYHKPKC